MKHQGLSWRGCQVFYATETGLDKDTIHLIFTGKRRASVRNAAVLEQAFRKNGVPLDRLDLLYGVSIGSESLPRYLERKLSEVNEEAHHA